MQKRLTVEYERWQQYLDTPTRKPLIGIVEEQLLRSHMPAILDKGFDALMTEKRYICMPLVICTSLCDLMCP